MLGGGGRQRPRKRISSRLATENGAQHRARSLHLEIMIWAEMKNWMLNPVSLPGSPEKNVSYTKCQLINVEGEGIRKLIIWWPPWLPATWPRNILATKIGQWKWKRWDIYVMSKYFPIEHLINCKGKNNNCSGEPGRHHLNQVVEVMTSQPHVDGMGQIQILFSLIGYNETDPTCSVGFLPKRHPLKWMKRPPTHPSKGHSRKQLTCTFPKC